MSKTLSFAEAIRSGASPEEITIALPNLAILVMGQSGVGKTHFIGTAEKPIVVQQFDPPDKSATYENLGYLPGPLETTKWGAVQTYYSPKQPERWVIRVEYFDEPDPRNARAFANFMARMNDIEKDIKEWGVRTVALDSITFLETAARFYNKYTYHPSNKSGKEVQDERIHYRASAAAVEEWVTGRYPGLQRLCNVLLVAHVQSIVAEDAGADEDQRVERKTVAAPGKQAGKIPAALSEVYRLYMDDKGHRWLQTALRPGQNLFECKSVRGLKDPTQAHWQAIVKQISEKYAIRMEELRKNGK